MSSLAIALIGVAVATVIQGSATSPAVSSTIKGRILDSEGAAVNARILFHPDPSGVGRPVARREVRRETGEEGLCEVDLDPGFYGVCVMARAFTPECRKVFLTVCQSLRFDTKLKVDPLIVQHFGDIIRR